MESSGREWTCQPSSAIAIRSNKFKHNHHLELGVVTESPTEDPIPSTHDARKKIKKWSCTVCKSAALLILAMVIGGIIAIPITLYILEKQAQVGV